MSVRQQRAALLISQDRHEAAVRELKQAILEEPNEPYHYGLLAVALSRLDRHQRALEAASKAVDLSPDQSYGHYVRAVVFLDRNRYREAREALWRAVELEPDDVDSYGLLAKAEFGLNRWSEALQAANRGLAIDAIDDTCLHWRSLALARLGRKEEAEATLNKLTAADPNDPYTHETHGWFALERGDADAARQHFLESLRLKPTNDGARAGLASALKARHWLFGRILQGLIFLGRYRAWVIWLFLLEVLVGLHMIDHLTAVHPEWDIDFLWVKAVFFSILGLILLAQPLFDLILRLDREGRRALTPELTRASNWSALCLVAALGLGTLWAWRGDPQLAILAWATLSLPQAIRHTCTASAGWVRMRMRLLTLVATLLIPLSFLLFVMTIWMIVRWKMDPIWLISVSLLYLPLVSVLLSAFADYIHRFLEQRKPDLIAHA